MTGKAVENPIKLSIITAVYNRVDMIADAIESIKEQWQPGLEHIIVDGGSTDGTLDVINNYSHLQVISESDNGIYSAWNKGVKKARGEWVTFLNSDDNWFEDVIKDLLLSLDKQYDVITTDSYLFKLSLNGNKEIIGKYVALEGIEYIDSLVNRGPAINAWIIKKELVLSLGLFNERFKKASDVDFCIKTIFSGSKFLNCKTSFYQYFQHEGSATFNHETRNQFEFLYENYLVGIENFKLAKSTSQFKKSLGIWVLIIGADTFVNGLFSKHQSRSILTIFSECIRISPKFLFHVIKRILYHFWKKLSK